MLEMVLDRVTLQKAADRLVQRGDLTVSETLDGVGGEAAFKMASGGDDADRAILRVVNVSDGLEGCRGLLNNVGVGGVAVVLLECLGGLEAEKDGKLIEQVDHVALRDQTHNVLASGIHDQHSMGALAHGLHGGVEGVVDAQQVRLANGQPVATRELAEGLRWKQLRRVAEGLVDEQQGQQADHVDKADDQILFVLQRCGEKVLVGQLSECLLGGLVGVEARGRALGHDVRDVDGEKGLLVHFQL